MMDFLFNSLWGWLGIGGAVIAGALAVAWFIPPFRKLALTVAGIAAGVLGIYAKGSRDAAQREREKHAAAERAMVDKSNAARRDAQRDADAGILPDDGFDRSKGKVRRP